MSACLRNYNINNGWLAMVQFDFCEEHFLKTFGVYCQNLSSLGQFEEF